MPSGTLFPFRLNFPSNCSSAPPQLSQILPDKGGGLGTENMDFEGQWLQNIKYVKVRLCHLTAGLTQVTLPV